MLFGHVLLCISLLQSCRGTVTGVTSTGPFESSDEKEESA